MNHPVPRILFVFLLSLTFSALHSQELSGIWRGHFRSTSMYDRSLSDDDRYKFEVQISQKEKTFQAVTYSYKTTVFYGKAEADGTVNQKTQKVLLRELRIVEVRMMGGDACNMTCFLTYTKLGDEEFLEGTYTSMNTRDSSTCGKGSVFLRKVANSDFYEEPFLLKNDKKDNPEKKKIPEPARPATHKNDVAAAPTHKPSPEKKATVPVRKPAATPGLASKVAPNKAVTGTAVRVKKPHVTAPPIAKANTDKHVVQSLKIDSAVVIDKKIAPIKDIPQVLAARRNELVKTITVNTNDIELNIYDDGAIDHDTVSVYLDKKLVVSHAMLTDRAIIVKLHLDDNDDYHEIVMVAENEGEIPPNTSLMVVKAGDKQYEVRIVSTEQKNATVVFKYEHAK